MSHRRALSLTLAPLASPLLFVAPSLAQTTTLEGDVELLWESRTDATIATDEDTLTATSEAGVLYAAGSTGTFEASLLVTATEAGTGNELWSFVLDDGESHAADSILLANGVLVVGAKQFVSGFSGNQGLLLGLDASDGSLLWSRLEGSPSSVWGTFWTSFPELREAGAPGQLVAVEARSFVDPYNPYYSPDTTERLHRIDAATGQSQWTQFTSSLHHVAGMEVSPDGSAFALVGSFANVGGFGSVSWDYVAELRSVADGSTLWSVPLATGLPTVFGSTVGGRCVAWDPSGQRVLFGGSCPAPQVFGLDASNGNAQWSFGELDFQALQLEVDANGLAVVAGDSGGQLRVHALAEDTGALNWSSSGGSIFTIDDLWLDASTQRAVLCASDDLFASSDAWQLSAFDTTNGNLAWESNFGAGDSLQDWAVQLVSGPDAASVWAAGSRHDAGFGGRALWREHALFDGALLQEATHDQAPLAADQSVQSTLLSADGSTLWNGGARGWESGTGGVVAQGAWLSASSTADGSSLWVRQFESLSSSSPRIESLAENAAQARLFVGGRFDQDEGYVRALNALTGADLWEVKFDLHDSYDEVEDLDVVPGTQVLLVTTQTNDEVGLLALDAVTGATLWSQLFGVADGNHAPLTLVRSDGTRAYFVSTEYTFGGNQGNIFVLSLDPSTGAVDWFQALDSDGANPFWDADHLDDAALSPDESAIYVYSYASFDQPVGDGSATYRLDAATGNVQWSTSIPTPVDFDYIRPRRLCVSPDGSTIYTMAVYWTNWAAQHIDLLLTAMDASTGQVLWTTQYFTGAWEDQNGFQLQTSQDGETLILVAGHGTNYPDLQGLTAGFDADTGTPLWSAKLIGNAEVEEPTVGLAVLPDGRTVIGASQSAVEPGNRDLVLQAFELPGLSAVPSTISVAAGGAQSFDLSGGAAEAGQLAFLLGSLSGTGPGIDLGGGHLLPLVYDAYTALTLATPNAPPLSNSFGPLNADGHAEAQFSLPAGSAPSLAGLHLDHAWVALDASGVRFASNAVGVDLVP